MSILSIIFGEPFNLCVLRYEGKRLENESLLIVDGDSTYSFFCSELKASSVNQKTNPKRRLILIEA